MLYAWSQCMQVRSIAADIIHCHDWPTAPIAWGDRGRSRCVFTIHNLSYGADLVGRAMASCEVATTVSPTYAREVRISGIRSATCILCMKMNFKVV
jgi:glycogen synthase